MGEGGNVAEITNNKATIKASVRLWQARGKQRSHLFSGLQSEQDLAHLSRFAISAVLTLSAADVQQLGVASLLPPAQIEPYPRLPRELVGVSAGTPMPSCRTLTCFSAAEIKLRSCCLYAPLAVRTVLSKKRRAACHSQGIMHDICKTIDAVAESRRCLQCAHIAH